MVGLSSALVARFGGQSGISSNHDVNGACFTKVMNTTFFSVASDY
jgi:hypothetical protein